MNTVIPKAKTLSLLDENKYLTHDLVCDCLLSRNRPSLFRVFKATKAEEQFHASFMHDIGKNFHLQRFLAELDIYVKLTTIEFIYM